MRVGLALALVVPGLIAAYIAFRPDPASVESLETPPPQPQQEPKSSPAPAPPVSQQPDAEPADSVSPGSRSDANSAGTGAESGLYSRYADWKRACDRLPSNRSLRNWPDRDLLPITEFVHLDDLLDRFFELVRRGAFGVEERWIGAAPEFTPLFDPATGYFVDPKVPFQPFVQKLAVEPGTRAVFHGDFHGDIRSLIAEIDWLNARGWMDGWNLVAPDLHLIFLGDYTDRGRYGVEVVYTLLRLKLANPDKVWMVRGNHEDVSLTARYGFLAEAQAKFGRTFNAVKFSKIYDLMPVALYFGCGGDFIQCCHGGMEPGYSPAGLLSSGGPLRFELLGELRRAGFLEQNPQVRAGLDPGSRSELDARLVDFMPTSPATPDPIGFMWNDFYPLREQPSLGYTIGRAFLFGREAVRRILLASDSGAGRVRAVFRAHQHSSVPNPMMRRLLASDGVFRHWQEADDLAHLDHSVDDLAKTLDRAATRSIPDGSVWTFNVAPDTVYGEALNYRTDTTGLVTTAPGFEDWKLEVVEQVISE